MPGPIGELEDKAIDTVSKMAWFKNLTFGQVLILISLTAIFCGIGYGVPWGVSKIQDFGEKQEKSHREEREARDSAMLTAMKEAHEKTAERDRKRDDSEEKRWGIVRDIMLRNPKVGFGIQGDFGSEPTAVGPPGLDHPCD